MYKIVLFLVLALVAKESVANIDTVYVYNTEFSVNPPNEPIRPATIYVGDTILWYWLQGDHTTTSVTASSEQWDQNINQNSTEYMRRFDNTGVFWYYCQPHGQDNGDGTSSGMASYITVLAQGSGACCLPTGDCITTTSLDCFNQSGTFLGAGSTCDTATCYVSLELNADKDNTIYEYDSGDRSNGIGENLYAGNHNTIRRRSLIRFDLSMIPVHAILDTARLKLYCNESPGDATPVSVHALQKNWGEGTSNGQNEGGTATPGDATWLHNYYDTAFWQNPGADYLNSPSATTTISTNNIDYYWNSTQVNDDVQLWINDSTANNGWIIIGDELIAQNSKRFSSRESQQITQTPKLLLDYRVPPTGACCYDNGTCEITTEQRCLVEGGNYHGNGSTCEEISCVLELTPFVDQLPIPNVASPQSGRIGGTAHYRVEIEEHFQQLHAELPPTRVWGYNGTYPGPTFETWKDSLVTVQWVNNIRVAETGELRSKHVLTVDTCIHGPNITKEAPVTVTHLHGGKVEPGSDGYPEDIFYPGDSANLYYYPNIQQSGILWYHDHALGITRLNVMMGLAGLYYIRDSAELELNIPDGQYEVPLVIQDKTMNADGSMQYPAQINDHFFGDHILVNGKIWPYLNVHQGKYRFRLLNGSNSRTYTLYLSDHSKIQQIGTELGMLPTTQEIDSITIMPGERADIVIDFQNYAPGTEILLLNRAPAPYPGIGNVGVVPNVMKFIVQDLTGFTDPLPTSLIPSDDLLPENADKERVFELLTIPAAHECGNSHAPMWTINGLRWDTITEFPVLGSTEIWTWHNETGISHPMHMHLVQFKILDRQAIDINSRLPTGPLLSPAPYESGWKDTANCPPGYRTRTIARFTGFTGLFPYHCHILEHEDNEMMRQFKVLPCNIVNSKGNHGPGTLRYAIESCTEEGDTIWFVPELYGDTISLNDSLLISQSIHISNLGVEKIVIDGKATSHTLNVQSGAVVSIKNMKIIGGTNQLGSAIVNNGILKLEDIIVSKDNTVIQGKEKIINNGSLIINNEVIIHH